jgi:rhodanese-related sulfurtransferase
MNEVTVGELAAIPDAMIVDVREPFEFASGHAQRAVNIPMGELTGRHTELPTALPVYVICASGGRSAQATVFLVEVGHNAINVLGGTSAWQSARLPIER